MKSNKFKICKKRVIALIMAFLTLCTIFPFEVFADTIPSDIWDESTRPGKYYKDLPGHNGYYFDYVGGEIAWANAGTQSNPVIYRNMQWKDSSGSPVKRPIAGLKVTDGTNTYQIGYEGSREKENFTNPEQPEEATCETAPAVLKIPKGTTLTFSDASELPDGLLKGDFQVGAPYSGSYSPGSSVDGNKRSGWSQSLTFNTPTKKGDPYRIYYQVYTGKEEDCWNWGNFSINGAHYIPSTLTPAIPGSKVDVYGDWAFVQLNVEVIDPPNYQVFSRYFTDGKPAHVDEGSPTGSHTLTNVGDTAETNGNGADKYTVSYTKLDGSTAEANYKFVKARVFKASDVTIDLIKSGHTAGAYETTKESNTLKYSLTTNGLDRAESFIVCYDYLCTLPPDKKLDEGNNTGSDTTKEPIPLPPPPGKEDPPPSGKATVHVEYRLDSASGDRVSDDENYSYDIKEDPNNSIIDTLSVSPKTVDDYIYMKVGMESTPDSIFAVNKSSSTYNFTIKNPYTMVDGKEYVYKLVYVYKRKSTTQPYRETKTTNYDEHKDESKTADWSFTVNYQYIDKATGEQIGNAVTDMGAYHYRYEYHYSKTGTLVEEKLSTETEWREISNSVKEDESEDDDSSGDGNYDTYNGEWYFDTSKPTVNIPNGYTFDSIESSGTNMVSPSPLTKDMLNYILDRECYFTTSNSGSVSVDEKQSKDYTQTITIICTKVGDPGAEIDKDKIPTPHKPDGGGSGGLKGGEDPLGIQTGIGLSVASSSRVNYKYRTGDITGEAQSVARETNSVPMGSNVTPDMMFKTNPDGTVTGILGASQDYHNITMLLTNVDQTDGKNVTVKGSFNGIADIAKNPNLTGFELIGKNSNGDKVYNQITRVQASTNMHFDDPTKDSTRYKFYDYAIQDTSNKKQFHVPLQANTSVSSHSYNKFASASASKIGYGDFELYNEPPKVTASFSSTFNSKKLIPNLYYATVPIDIATTFTDEEKDAQKITITIGRGSAAGKNILYTYTIDRSYDSNKEGSKYEDNVKENITRNSYVMDPTSTVYASSTNFENNKTNVLNTTITFNEKGTYWYLATITDAVTDPIFSLTAKTNSGLPIILDVKSPPEPPVAVISSTDYAYVGDMDVPQASYDPNDTPNFEDITTYEWKWTTNTKDGFTATVSGVNVNPNNTDKYDKVSNTANVPIIVTKKPINNSDPFKSDGKEGLTVTFPEEAKGFWYPFDLKVTDHTDLTNTTKKYIKVIADVPIANLEPEYPDPDIPPDDPSTPTKPDYPSPDNPDDPKPKNEYDRDNNAGYDKGRIKENREIIFNASKSRQPKNTDNAIIWADTIWTVKNNNTGESFQLRNSNKSNSKTCKDGSMMYAELVPVQTNSGTKALAGINFQADLTKVEPDEVTYTITVKLSNKYVKDNPNDADAAAAIASADITVVKDIVPTLTLAAYANNSPTAFVNGDVPTFDPNVKNHTLTVKASAGSVDNDSIFPLHQWLIHPPTTYSWKITHGTVLRKGSSFTADNRTITATYSGREDTLDYSGYSGITKSKGQPNITVPVSKIANQKGYDVYRVRATVTESFTQYSIKSALNVIDSLGGSDAGRYYRSTTQVRDITVNFKPIPTISPIDKTTDPNNPTPIPPVPDPNNPNPNQPNDPYPNRPTPKPDDIYGPTENENGDKIWATKAYTDDTLTFKLGLDDEVPETVKVVWTISKKNPDGTYSEIPIDTPYITKNTLGHDGGDIQIEEPGWYILKATVTDEFGATSTTTIYIRIYMLPIAVLMQDITQEKVTEFSGATVISSPLIYSGKLSDAHGSKTDTNRRDFTTRENIRFTLSGLLSINENTKDRVYCTYSNGMITNIYYAKSPQRTGDVPYYSIAKDADWKRAVVEAAKWGPAWHELDFSKDEWSIEPQNGQRIADIHVAGDNFTTRLYTDDSSRTNLLHRKNTSLYIASPSSNDGYKSKYRSFGFTSVGDYLMEYRVTNVHKKTSLPTNSMIKVEVDEAPVINMKTDDVLYRAVDDTTGTRSTTITAYHNRYTNHINGSDPYMNVQTKDGDFILSTTALTAYDSNNDGVYNQTIGSNTIKNANLSSSKTVQKYMDEMASNLTKNASYTKTTAEKTMTFKRAAFRSPLEIIRKRTMDFFNLNIGVKSTSANPNLGKYKIEVTAKELPNYPILATSVLSDSYFKNATMVGYTKVDNSEPTATYQTVQKMPVDVVLVCSSCKDIDEVQTNFNNNMKNWLDTNPYIDSQVNTVEAVKQETISSFEWHKDVKDSIGSVTESGNTVQFKGNKLLEGKNIAWTDVEDVGAIKITFDYSVDYGDSLNATGILFNITETYDYLGTDESGIPIYTNRLHGYMLALPKNVNDIRSSIDGYKIYEFTYNKGENLCNFNSGSSKITAIKDISEAVSNVGGTITLTATKNNVKVTGNKGTVSVDLPNSYGYGFGFFEETYQHDCEDVGFAEFKNISIETTQVKSISESLSDTQFRSGAAKFLIYLNEDTTNSIEEYAKTALYIEDIESLTASDYYFAVLGSSQYSGNDTSLKKYYIDKLGKDKNGVDRSKYFNIASGGVPTQLQAISSWIQTFFQYFDAYTNWILVNSEVLWNTTYNDPERDLPLNYIKDDLTKNNISSWGVWTANANKYFDTDSINNANKLQAEKWRFTHYPEYFDNSMGYIADNAVWIKSPYDFFDKTGLYRINYRRKDNPFYSNASLTHAFAEYRKWSHYYDY